MMTDSQIDILVRAAKPVVMMPATFRAEVWRRITVAEETMIEARIARWLDPMFSRLARPTVAAALCAVMVSAGLWLGTQRNDTATREKLAYLQAVSPFLTVQLSAK